MSKKNNVVKGFEWDTEQVLNANLMFPTTHFQNAEELALKSDEEFSQFIIELITPVQPLDNFERTGLAQSVKSQNRLRVYYHAMRIIERRIAVANETETLGCEGAALSDLIDGHGIQVKQEGIPDAVDEEFADEVK